MDADTQPSLELLVTTNINEFVKQFLSDVHLVNGAYGRPSLGATLEHIYGQYGEKSLRGRTVDGISLELVHDFGGHEGEGETVERVYAIIKDTWRIAYFNISGWYASECGTEWNGVFTRVYPHQVIVTKYSQNKDML